MSARRSTGRARKGAPALAAPVFAALGDETRLALLARLSRGDRLSISQLSAGASVTRQAVTKHLRVLEAARIVCCARSGRESLFELDPKPIDELRKYLAQISLEWDDALLRLKGFVEE